jgi:hypothetical protein
MRKAVGVFLVLTLAFLTGCGGSGDSLSEIKSALNVSFPDCTFEPVTTSSALIRDNNKEYEISYTTYPLSDPDITSGQDGDTYFNQATFNSGKSNNFEVCNTQGISLANIEEYASVVNQSISDITGLEGGYCWSKFSDTSDRLKACAEQLPLNSKVGVWFVIQKFESDDDAKAHALDVANRNFGYYADYPIAYKDNYVFMFTGQIKDISQSYVEEIDASWANLVDSVGAKLVSDEISGYSLLYDFEDAYDPGSNHCGLRCDVGLGIAYENP